MRRLASWLIRLGLALTVTGLVVGFSALFLDADTAAVNALVLVPVGFALGLTGLTMGQLSGDAPQRNPGTGD